MFPRKISLKLAGYAQKYKAIALIGPRQSGKTTLAKYQFPEHDYLSLENPDTRSFAIEDPRYFLKNIKNNVILDEVQNAPHLFSYLQEILDDKSDKRQFIITGSNSFLLSEKISQSLAGRIRILNILPLLRSEFPKDLKSNDLNKCLLYGSYPAIFDQALNPTDWYSDYYNTYIQKDVRNTLEVSNLIQFDRFIRVSAGRIGQLTNYSIIGSEIGISQPTAVKWSSVLEASFLTFRLAPHFKNFGKQIIKSPKVYFYDTGLLCFLLRIKNTEQLSTHPLRGAIFENWVISEYLKNIYAKAEEPNLYFWRDQHGHEIDLIQDNGTYLFPIEIKSGSTYHSSWQKNLTWFQKIQFQKTQKEEQSTLIYGGDKSLNRNKCEIVSWLKLNL